jgi:hypothetical protein
MIADVLRVYGEEVAPAMKSRRLIAYHMSNILKWWGDKTAAQITMRTCKSMQPPGRHRRRQPI